MDVDLTLRCAGRRIAEVLRGEPARIRGAVLHHPSGDYLLERDWFVMAAFRDYREPDDPFPTRHDQISIACPNHKGGHFVGGTLLRVEVEEARRKGGGRSTSVSRVVVPLLDGTPYDKD